MPAASVLVSSLASTAAEFRPLAIAWHAAAALILALILSGWRPPTRVLAGLLMLPVASVGGVAWASGNPFNGTTFLLLTVVLGFVARRLPSDSVRLTGGVPFVAAVGLAAFGWMYPHFVDGGFLAYAYAGPLGVLPCPTLSLVVGVTLACGSFWSAAWGRTVALAAICYGAYGAFRLGVTIDLVLLAGGVELATGTGLLKIRAAAR